MNFQGFLLCIIIRKIEEGDFTKCFFRISYKNGAIFVCT